MSVACTSCGTPLGRYEVGVCRQCARAPEHIKSILPRVWAAITGKAA